MSVQSHCHPHGSTLPYQPYQMVGNYTTVRTPHTCPVCQGKGEHPRGFYGPRDPAEGNPDPCRSCEKGVVWETRQEYAPTWVYPPVYQEYHYTVPPWDYQTYQVADSVTLNPALPNSVPWNPFTGAIG